MSKEQMPDNIARLAKNFRNAPTSAENILWSHLRLKQIEGHKFRRQVPLGDYMVDFICFKKRLVIEVDGGQHDGSAGDSIRDGWLNKNGYIVLRFWNNEVSGNIEGVVDRIREVLLMAPSP